MLYHLFSFISIIIESVQVLLSEILWRYLFLQIDKKSRINFLRDQNIMKKTIIFCIIYSNTGYFPCRKLIQLEKLYVNVRTVLVQIHTKMIHPGIQDIDYILIIFNTVYYCFYHIVHNVQKPLSYHQNDLETKGCHIFKLWWKKKLFFNYWTAFCESEKWTLYTLLIRYYEKT